MPRRAAVLAAIPDHPDGGRGYGHRVSMPPVSVRRVQPRMEDAPARHLTEAEFRQEVKDLLTLYGWHWQYNPHTKWVQGHRGLPDLIAARGGRVLFFELKRANGIVSPEQAEWLRQINAGPLAAALVVRPDDLEFVQKVLR